MDEDDPCDYLAYTTPSGGFGYYIEVTKLSGNVVVTTYDPTGDDLSNSRYNNTLWLSLAPGTTFYIKIQPDFPYDAVYEYRINVAVNAIPDALEHNDTITQAKPLSSIGTQRLCNVITSDGIGTHFLKGLWDTYRIDGHSTKTMKVSLTNAGFPSGLSGDVIAAVLDETGDPLQSGDRDTFIGTKDGVIFEFENLPASATYIMFYQSLSNRPSTRGSGGNDELQPYGEGTGPDCYKSPGPGYNLTITFH